MRSVERQLGYQDDDAQPDAFHSDRPLVAPRFSMVPLPG